MWRWPDWPPGYHARTKHQLLAELEKLHPYMMENVGNTEISRVCPHLSEVAGGTLTTFTYQEEIVLPTCQSCVLHLIMVLPINLIMFQIFYPCVLAPFFIY